MSDTRRETVVIEPTDDLPSDEADASEPPVGRDAEARVARLSEGADALRTRAGAFVERTGILLIVSAVLVTLGLSLILVAWRGVSRSIHVEEQMPYLISGGILGGTLAIIGAFCLFTHWLTVGIRESRAREERARRRHEELLDALVGDRPHIEGGGGNNGDAFGDRRQRPLRSAPRRS